MAGAIAMTFSFRAAVSKKKQKRADGGQKKLLPLIKQTPTHTHSLPVCLYSSPPLSLSLALVPFCSCAWAGVCQTNEPRCPHTPPFTAHCSHLQYV